MPRIVFRYLFFEAVRTWLIVAGVLLFLTLGLSLAQYIADAAAGKLPVNTVLVLALLGAVGNLQIVMPVSVLLAVLLTLGRLCQDNEMAALYASGIRLRVLYRPFFALALLVAVIAGTASIFAAPMAERTMQRLGAASATAMINTLAPGRFRTFLDGGAVFYAARRDADGNLRKVFIRVETDSNGQPKQTVVTADRAREQTDPDSGRVTLVLDDGWRYEGYPGRAAYRVIRFAEHGVEIAPGRRASRLNVNAQSFTTLIASDDPKAAAEWQTRVSVPLSIFILTLLALPIGRVPPRAGRYARVIAGILFYVIYVNGVQLAANAVEDATIPASIGVWWVHALVFALAVALVMREQGVFARHEAGAAP